MLTREGPQPEDRGIAVVELGRERREARVSTRSCRGTTEILTNTIPIHHVDSLKMMYGINNHVVFISAPRVSARSDRFANRHEGRI